VDSKKRKKKKCEGGSDRAGEISVQTRREGGLGTDLPYTIGRLTKGGRMGRVENSSLQQHKRGKIVKKKYEPALVELLAK